MQTDPNHEIELAPSPSRLVESLRDTGYSYQAAFADIVDNSIAAGANHVEIDIKESIYGGEITVAFYDNGSGMDESAIVNAMRYGSEKRPSPKSLGKFGMGLKTASTSFCKKLTVISKSNGELSARCWDIETIKSRDKWILITPTLEEYAGHLDKLTKISGDTNGTIVVWEEVDRLINNSGTDYTAQAIDHLIKDIREHLSATFGKFLIGLSSFNSMVPETQSYPDIKILINDEPLIGWDPTGKFLNSNKEPDRVLIEKGSHTVTLHSEGISRTSKFELNGYVLPNKNRMSDDELKAVRFGNDNQGFYIYRENRLIFGGGWPHRLFSQDAHLNLLRVELNFDHQLDDYFEIDIRKSKINLPLKIRNNLKQALAPWRNQAQSRYRTNNPSQITIDPVDDRSSHSGSSRAIQLQQANTGRVEVVSFDKNSSTISIKNRFGVVEINRAAIVLGTNVFVTTVSSIEGGMLWEIDISEEENTVVILNEEHEFYRRFYQSKEITPVLVQAMDSLFWALANAELNSISEPARRNFEELRLSLSNSLKHLAKELPDVE
jgi:hypothetical protein